MASDNDFHSNLTLYFILKNNYGLNYNKSFVYLLCCSDIPLDIDSVNININNKEKMSKDKEVGR